MDPDALERASRVTDDEKNLKFVWFAFLNACLIYAVIAYFVGSDRQDPVELSIRNWLLTFAAMASGLQILTVFLLRQAIAGLTRGNYRVYCIVRWALLEAIAIYGLVLFFMGLDLSIAIIFLAAAGLAIGAVRPGGTDRAAFVEQFR